MLELLVHHVTSRLLKVNIIGLSFVFLCSAHKHTHFHVQNKILGDSDLLGIFLTFRKKVSRSYSSGQGQRSMGLSTLEDGSITSLRNEWQHLHKEAVSHLGRPESSGTSMETSALTCNYTCFLRM
jgi:hypothetical protein